MQETDNLEIDPSRLRRPRRNVPPGQNRHNYADTTDTLDMEDDVWPDTPDEAPEQSRQAPGRRRQAPAPREEDTGEAYTDDNALVRFFTGSRLHGFIGTVCVLVGAAMVIMLLTHMSKGALDQTIIMNMDVARIVADDGTTVHNPLGPFGAWAAHVLFTRSLGIGAFVLAGYLIVLGAALLGLRRKVNFWSLTFKSLLLAISVSIIAALVTYGLESTVFWGGVHGHYINKYLLDTTGWLGAVVVSGILAAAVVTLYLTDLTRFVKAVRKGSGRVLPHRVAPDPVLQDTPDYGDPAINATDGGGEPLEVETILTPVNPAPATDPAGDDVAFEIDVPQDRREAVNDDAAADGGFSIEAPMMDTGGDTILTQTQDLAEGDYDPRASLSRFVFPSLDMLDQRPMTNTIDQEEQQNNKNRIVRTLQDYKITVVSIKATVGPTVTLYEIVPDKGIKIAKIKNLEDDIAMSLAAKGIRIIAPMPGKGTIGIEVPNNEPQTVSMRTVLESRRFKESKAALPVALGATISNEVFVADLADMPHALVAGATGQGKSVGLNAIITSLLYKKHPSELKFVLIDPKMVEFSLYEALSRHYLASLPGEEEAVVTDPNKVLGVLKSLCVEMDRRYALLKKAGVNKITHYNAKFVKHRLPPADGHGYMPYIVVVVDEFADLIMMGGKEIENPVMRITQKARAVGIHMIIATQRPSTNVLTGLIKANCPTRVAFRVMQMVDSRTILDRPGAERLIGRGDMLYSQGGEMERMQCAFISTPEVETICNFIEQQPGFDGPLQLPDPDMCTEPTIGAAAIAGAAMDRDPLFNDAAEFVVSKNLGSTSSLQRKFDIGYNRAGRLMDQMEAAGIVGPAQGSKPRQVLVDFIALQQILGLR